MAFTYIEKLYIYNPLISAFNKYAEDNNLDIYLKLTILSPNNSTSIINNYGSTVDSLLSKQSDKYDLYFYYDSYTKRYGPHFLYLDKYIPKEHINMYDNGIIENSCIYNNHIVGLVSNFLSIFFFFIK